MQHLIGCIVGAYVLLSLFQSTAGMVTGAIVGGLTTLSLQLRKQVRQQQVQLQALSTQIKQLSASAVATPIAPAPETQHPAIEPAPPEPAEAVREPEVDVAAPAPAVSEPAIAAMNATPEPAQVAEPVAVQPVSPRESVPAAPAQPAPSVLDKAKQWVLDYFTGGNLMVRVGVLILFFGVAFLLKYTAERVVVPVGLRYWGVVAAAAVMLGLGWRLRRKSTQYALVMQGGAVGVLYLVVFAAFRLHDLLNATPAFALMLAVVLLTAILAIVQNAVWLAAVGVTGGFAAPLLASTGAGSHVELFTYYLILNIGILLIALYRSWRFLNWLGFVFTFGIGLLWGAQYYQPPYLATTEPFLLAFFALYTLIPLLFARKQPPQLKGLVDGTLVFGTPVAFMGLQSQLVADYQGFPQLMAWSSAGIGLLYGILALVLRRPGFGLLRESYLALAVAFLTLAIPLAFDGRITSALWAVEGAALVWVGLRQRRLLPRLSGLGLMLVAAYFYLDEPSADVSTFLLNTDWLGTLLLTVAAGFAAACYRRYREPLTELEQKLAYPVLLIWGFGWWLAGGLDEIQCYFGGVPELFGQEVFLALTATLYWLLARRSQTSVAVLLSLVTVATGLMLLLSGSEFYASPRAWFNLNMAAGAVWAGCCLWMAVYAWHRNFTAFSPAVGRAQVLLIWLAVLVLLGFGWSEIDHTVSWQIRPSIALLYALVPLLGLLALSYRYQWPALTGPSLLILPCMALTLTMYVIRDQHLGANYGWLVFPLALAAFHGALKSRERFTLAWLGRWHLVSLLIVTLALGWQGAKLFEGYGANLWSLSAWGVVFVVALLAVRQLRERIWPFTRFPAELGLQLPRILLGLLGLWLVACNLQTPGQAGPVPYVPLFNVLDLTCLAAVAVMLWWLHRDDPDYLRQPHYFAYWIPGALGFLWLNAALLRAFHFQLEIPYQFEIMVRSIAVQSGLSILWSLLGLVLMVLATRRGWRALWIVGAGLMAAVVLKLFTVDLSGTGTIARIIAFLTVGVLLLVVGYFAPVPPGEKAQAQDEG